MTTVYKKKIIVTGASGFLGSWICRMLSEKYEIIALIRPKSNTIRLLTINGIKIQRLNPEKWGQFISESKCDAWISAEWQGVSNTDRNDSEQINNFYRIKKLSTEVKNVQTVIVFGSQAELGPVDHPISEIQDDNPTTKYGEVKVLTRKYLEKFYNESQTRFIWGRVFSTYGPMDAGNWLIPSTINSLLKNKVIALTKGEQIWSFLHVVDFANSIDFMLSKLKIAGVVNIGNIELSKVSDVTSYIANKLERPHLLNFGAIEYRPDQVMLLAPICETLTSQGWSPTIRLEDGLDHLISWYKGERNKNLLLRTDQELILNLPFM